MKLNRLEKAISAVSTCLITLMLVGTGCDRSVIETPPAEVDEISIDDDFARAWAEQIRGQVSATVDTQLELTLWAADTLLADPVALDIDDHGRAFVTRTNRRKSTEFDIRQHPYWERASLSFQHVDDRRNFLHKTLTPASTGQFHKPYDHNQDSLQTWEDLTVESEQVYRIEDRTGDGLADYTTLVATGFQTEVTDIAGGVMAWNDEVFLAVAPDLWRLQDPDGDGYMEQRTSLIHGFQVHIGFGGHNMSGIKMGPDGRIYWGIGDIGFNGVDQEGNRWSYPNQGVIARCNPDGSDFEIFAAGLRNTHEFAFDAYGNLISVDNDGDHPGESERLVYIVNGSDSGWRINWQFGKYRDPDNNEYKVWMDEELYKPRFEGQAAFITPCIRNYINGPTGMVYNPGTALGPQWADRFFVVEFSGNPARSGIHSFQLKPQGATFAFEAGEKILGGVLATGMDFGPDGALYFTDWIDGWEKKGFGRIWKLDVKQNAWQAKRNETRTLLEMDFGLKSGEELLTLLEHPDMRVRMKSQFALVDLGDEALPLLQSVLAEAAPQLKRVHAIWAIGQLMRLHGVKTDALSDLLDDEDAEIRAQAARILGDVKYRPAADALIPLLQDTSARVQFFAAEALGRMAAEQAVEPIISMLEANNDEDAYLRHAGSLALARIGEVESLVALADSPSRALRVAAVLALRRLRAPGISSFLADPDEYVLTEAARAINDDLSIDQALPDLGRVLERKDISGEALIRRALNANLRVGTEGGIKLLEEFAKDPSQDEILRAEALACLGTWAEPSVFDRVDGRFRGEIKRDPSPVYEIAGSTLIRLLEDASLPVRLAAVKAIAHLDYRDNLAAVSNRLEVDPDPSVRAEALRTLQSLQASDLERWFEQALQDEDAQVRVAALETIGGLEGDPSRLLDLMAGIIRTGTTTEQQAAMTALQQMSQNAVAPVVIDMLKQLTDGNIAAAIHLDLIEVAESLGNPACDSLIQEYRSSFTLQGLVADYAECLEGGDERQGRRILVNNSNAQCLKCHNVQGYGGVAGPDLDNVANRLSPEKILQSLIDPSVDLAPGFGVVTLVMPDDQVVSGILESETEAALVVRTSSGESVEVQKSEIEERINALSSMPAMGSVLTKREIRDLMAFLQTMRGEVE